MWDREYREMARKQVIAQSLDARFTQFGRFDSVLCRVGIHKAREAATSTPTLGRWRCWCGGRFWAQPEGEVRREYRQPRNRP